MATADPIDPYIITALKLLHSSAPDSAEKIRQMLDNEITKQKYDKAKLISNLLTKKLKDDERNAPGSGFKKHKPKKPVEEVKLVSIPTPAEQEVISIDRSDSEEDASGEDTGAMVEDLLELTCVECRQMDNSANNQLFECVECHLLHHQNCHSPKIPIDTEPLTWVCVTCKNKKEKEGPSTKATKCYDSSSSSSTASSSKNKSKERATPEVVKPATTSTSEKKKLDVKKKSKELSSTSRSRSSKK